jgi:hypothetical protein
VSIHTIRLRGPWQAETSAGVGELSLPGPLPGWIFAAGRPETPETILLRRQFNRPTGLEGQRVDLVIAACSLPIQVVLNGHRLPQQTVEAVAQRWEITPLLRPRNELQVELDCPTPAESEPALGLVALEIGADGSPLI